MTNPADLITESRLVELTKQMVAIPSITANEKVIGDWMEARFQEMGLPNIRRLPVDESGDTIVAWTDGPADQPSMLLNFHLDTFPICDGWETDPFTPITNGNRLYGLGAHDIKGGGACVLGAVEAIMHSGVHLNGRLIIATTTDEENWSRGAHAVIQTGLLDHCDYCLIPEPTIPGTLRIGGRGRHVFKLAFNGRTAQAAYGGGINAVTDAAKVVAKLAEPNSINLGHSEQFEMQGSVCVIGFHGGSTIILVPEKAEVIIDRHILPGQTVEEAAAQIEAVVQATHIEASHTLSWDDRPTPAPTAYIVPPDSRFVQTVADNMAREQDREIKLVLGRSVADTNHFAVYGKVPTLVYGPRGGNTCAANEYVEIDSLLEVSRTYAQSVMDLLGSHET